MLKNVIAWLIFNALLVAMSAIGIGVLAGLLSVLQAFNLTWLSGVATFVAVASAWGFAYGAWRFIQHLGVRKKAG